MSVTLAVPQFVDTDLATITAGLVTRFEALTGRTLYPAQVERIFIDLLAYCSKLQREAFQMGCLQQLVAYANGVHLDHLGQLVNVTRLGAQGATTRMRFTVAAGWTEDLVIPAGFAIQTKDGKATFATLTSCLLPFGTAQVEVLVVCQTPGLSANGYQAGDVATILRPLDGLAGAMNVTTSTNGTDPETDDHLRERIMQAPAHFSTAGPGKAYEFLAMSAHPDIIDVAVESPEAGVVAVYPLLASGLPNEDLLALVAAALSGDTVRPLCDEVRVLAPVQVLFPLNARLTLFSWADPTTTLAQAQAAAEAYRKDRQAGLGRDLIDSQIISSLSVDGVYRVEMEDWINQVLGPNEWACCSSISILQTGVANG